MERESGGECVRERESGRSSGKREGGRETVHEDLEGE